MTIYGTLTRCDQAISLVCSRDISVQLVAAQEAANSSHRMMATFSEGSPRHGIGLAELWSCRLTHIEAAYQFTQRSRAQQMHIVTSHIHARSGRALSLDFSWLVKS